MYKGNDQEIYDLVLEAGFVSREELDQIRRRAFEQDQALATVFLEKGMELEALLGLVSKETGVPMISQGSIDLIRAERLTDRLPKKLALGYGVLLVDESEEHCDLLVANPFDHNLEADLSHFLEKQVKLWMSDPVCVQKHLENLYGGDREDPKDINVVDAGAVVSGDSLNDATIVDYVDMLIQKSIREGASDIHFEPFENSYRIRYRVDGNLKEIPSHTGHLGDVITSRIKVMAGLNIAEKRIPQDGRIQVQAMGRQVDIRVSTLPTQFGESVVLRVLDKSNVNLDLDLLGMPERVLQQLRTAIHAPNGIFLATGPTGSGKTTTLYSALRELNDPESKLLTVEDPVEYDIGGIVQVQTHAMIGLDFARVLRAFLRHDPDRILLGEIRDTETARIAVQASLTGHMVFSSLHTNNASGAVTRFVDMGVEPYLVAASLVAVIAQRLLRRLNSEVSESYAPSDFELEQLGFAREDLNGRLFCRGNPSVEEHDLFKGRVGLYEMLSVNDEFREGITGMLSHMELERIAIRNGMDTLRVDALRVLLDGLSTTKEVLRYT